MDSRGEINISRFGKIQAEILFELLALQKLFPGSFLVEDPLYGLDENKLDEVKAALKGLMPLDSMVIDLWDWDIHFEDITLEESFFEIAFGSEKYALEQAEYLKEDFLRWIYEFGMDYDQHSFEGDGFEQLIHKECIAFILKWRTNIEKKVIGLTP